MQAKLEHLHTFLTVCAEGSLAAAARAMSLSAAAVSKQIAALEAGTGVSLLARTTRRLKLTEAGVVYRDYAIELLRTLGERESACLSQLRGQPVGKLRVAAARVLAERLLIPGLRQFIDSYPHIRLEIALVECFPDLEQDPVDLVFGMSMPGSTGLKRRSLGKTAYWLCAAPEYLAQHGEPASLDALASHRLIAHTMRRPPDQLVFKGGRTVSVPTVLALNDTTSMLEAARAGIGLVSLHHYMVEADVANGRLVRLLRHWEKPDISVDLFYRNTGRMQPVLRHFIDFAVAQCRLAPPDATTT